MAMQVERSSSFSANADKKQWNTPVIQTIAINAASGAAVGSKCDRYGSLSKGTGCP